ncbi:hypothetical protein D3C71_2044540 [compost metagenome]
MAGDSKAQAEYFAKALGGPGAQGWMSVDEVRRVKNLQPLGGEFDRPTRAGEQAQPEPEHDNDQDRETQNENSETASDGA